MTDSETTTGLSAEQMQVLDGFSAVNLDEVSPETVTVTFRSFLAAPELPAGYYIETTDKEIRTFVPMFLFNRMQANQKKVQRLRKKALLKAEFTTKETQPEQEDDVDFLEETPLNFATITHDAFKEMLAMADQAVVWQATEVLAVWRMTPGEEDMSLKRLMLGLDFEKIEALFLRFFVEKIRRRGIKV